MTNYQPAHLAVRRRKALLLALAFLALPVRAIADPSVFEREIAARIDRVSEFRAIRSIANDLGIRAWIFGGTASAFGHYVRWDLARGAGDKRYGANRFDYHYSNIYRSSQDLDVVIDATEEQRELFERRLQQRLPYVQGGKDKWEVRLLKQQTGDKESLLGNRDFLEQHTDSNSTGLIEISNPKNEESVVRDLRKWNASTSDFLEDLAKGRIHYYFSPTHETTSRAIAGKNPEILSAIRYLTKIVQYDLEPDARDLAIVREIVERFEPAKIKESYVQRWIEKNAPKLLQNSTDIERAWNLVDEIGLRKKLLKITQRGDEERSLAWWFTKEPLRSFPLGHGPGHSGNGGGQRNAGKTARELKLSTLSHGTSDFAAFEAITLSHMGLPNFFISREGQSGEAATYGNGVYFRIGKEGDGHSNFTIRVTLHPDAVAGKDFLRVAEDYVVVVNRNAIRVIPESLSVDVTEWFRMLMKGNQFSTADQGIVQGIRSRVEKDASHLTETQDREISALLHEARKDIVNHRSVFTEWSRLRLNLKHFQIDPIDEFRIAIISIIDGMTVPPTIEKTLESLRGLPHAERWAKFRSAVLKVKSGQERSLLYFGWLSSPKLSHETTVEEMMDMLFDTNGTKSYEATAYRERWSERVNQLLSADFSPARIQEIRKHFLAYVPTRGDERDAIFRAIEESKLPEKVVPLEDWIQLAADKRLATDYYARNAIQDILKRLDASATEASRRKSIDVARDVYQKNGGSLPGAFFEFWVNLRVTSKGATELLSGKAFEKKQIEPLFKSRAPSKVFTVAVERTNAPGFDHLVKTWGRYLGDPYFREILLEHSDLIIRRLLKEPAAVNASLIDAVVHEMREGPSTPLAPFFRQWVDAAISSGRSELLIPLAEAYSFSEIRPWREEFEKLVTYILADAKKNASLLAIIFKHVTVNDESGAPILQEPLKRILRYALAKKRADLLESAAKSWFRSDAFHEDYALVKSVVDFYYEARNWRGLAEFVRSSRGYLTKEGFDLILQVSEASNSRAVFEALVETIEPPSKTARRAETRRALAKLMETADRRKWVGALKRLAGNTFLTSSRRDAMPVEAFLDLLDLSFRHRDEKVLHDLIYWHLRERPKEITEHFALAHRELIRRAILLRGSLDKSEKAFSVLVQKEMEQNLRTANHNAWLPADLKRDYADFFAGKDQNLLKRYSGTGDEVAKAIARHRKLASPRACPKLLEKP